MPDDVVTIQTFLREAGFDTPAASRQARALLEAHQFTRPGKQGMAVAKIGPARELLTATFVRVCGHEDCLRLAQERTPARRPVVVSDASCEICGGSNNRRAAIQAVRVLKDRGINRLLIVGGTPAQHTELQQLLGEQGIRLRFVVGSEGRHTRREALPDLEWAQLLVVWGATPLPHKVSNLYTDDPGAHLRVVKLARRGIEALCTEIVRSLSAPAAR